VICILASLVHMAAEGSPSWTQRQVDLHMPPQIHCHSQCKNFQRFLLVFWRVVRSKVTGGWCHMTAMLNSIQQYDVETSCWIAVLMPQSRPCSGGRLSTDVHASMLCQTIMSVLLLGMLFRSVSFACIARSMLSNSRAPLSLQCNDKIACSAQVYLPVNFLWTDPLCFRGRFCRDLLQLSSTASPWTCFTVAHTNHEHKAYGVKCAHSFLAALRLGWLIFEFCWVSRHRGFTPRAVNESFRRINLILTSLYQISERSYSSSALFKQFAEIEGLSEL
jgi:hypothetical protein